MQAGSRFHRYGNGLSRAEAAEYAEEIAGKASRWDSYSSVIPGKRRTVSSAFLLRDLTRPPRPPRPPREISRRRNELRTLPECRQGLDFTDTETACLARRPRSTRSRPRVKLPGGIPIPASFQERNARFPPRSSSATFAAS